MQPCLANKIQTADVQSNISEIRLLENFVKRNINDDFKPLQLPALSYLKNNDDDTDSQFEIDDDNLTTSSLEHSSTPFSVEFNLDDVRLTSDDCHTGDDHVASLHFSLPVDVCESTEILDEIPNKSEYIETDFSKCIYQAPFTRPEIHVPEIQNDSVIIKEDNNKEYCIQNTGVAGTASSTSTASHFSWPMENSGDSTLPSSIVEPKIAGEDELDTNSHEDDDECAKKIQEHNSEHLVIEECIPQTDSHGTLTQTKNRELYLGEENTQVSHRMTSERKILQTTVKTTCAGFAGQTSQVIQKGQNMSTVVFSDPHEMDGTPTVTCSELSAIAGTSSITRLESTEKMQQEHDNVMASAKQTVSHIIQQSQKIASTHLISSHHVSTQTGASSRSERSVKQMQSMEQSSSFKTFSHNVQSPGDGISLSYDVQNLGNKHAKFESNHTTVTAATKHSILSDVPLYDDILSIPAEQHCSLYNPLEKISHQTCRIQEVTDDDDEEDEEIKKLTAGYELATYSLPSDLSADLETMYDSDNEETTQCNEQLIKALTHHTDTVESMQENIKVGFSQIAQKAQVDTITRVYSSEAVAAVNETFIEEKRSALIHTDTDEQEAVEPQLAQEMDIFGDFQKKEPLETGSEDCDVLDQRIDCNQEIKNESSKTDCDIYQEYAIESPSKIEDVTSQEITTESNLSISELDDDFYALDKEVNSMVASNISNLHEMEVQSNFVSDNYSNAMECINDSSLKVDRHETNGQQVPESFSIHEEKTIPKDVEEKTDDSIVQLTEGILYSSCSCYTDDIKREDSLMAMGESNASKIERTFKDLQLYTVEEAFVPTTNLHVMQCQNVFPTKEQLEANDQQTDLHTFIENESLCGKIVDVIDKKDAEIKKNTEVAEMYLKYCDTYETNVSIQKSSFQLNSQKPVENLDKKLTEVNMSFEELTSSLTNETMQGTQNTEGTPKNEFIVDNKDMHISTVLKKSSVHDHHGSAFESVKMTDLHSISNLEPEVNSVIVRSENILKSSENHEIHQLDCDEIDSSKSNLSDQKENIDYSVITNPIKKESLEIGNVNLMELEITQNTKSIEKNEIQSKENVIPRISLVETKVNQSYSNLETADAQCLKDSITNIECTNTENKKLDMPFDTAEMGIKKPFSNILKENEKSPTRFEPTEVLNKACITTEAGNKNKAVTTNTFVEAGTCLHVDSTKIDVMSRHAFSEKSTDMKNIVEDVESAKKKKKQNFSMTENIQEINSFVNIQHEEITDKVIPMDDEPLEHGQTENKMEIVESHGNVNCDKNINESTDVTTKNCVNTCSVPVITEKSKVESVASIQPGKESEVEYVMQTSEKCHDSFMKQTLQDIETPTLYLPHSGISDNRKEVIPAFQVADTENAVEDKENTIAESYIPNLEVKALQKDPINHRYQHTKIVTKHSKQSESMKAGIGTEFAKESDQKNINSEKSAMLNLIVPDVGLSQNLSHITSIREYTVQTEGKVQNNAIFIETSNEQVDIKQSDSHKENSSVKYQVKRSESVNKKLNEIVSNDTNDNEETAISADVYYLHKEPYVDKNTKNDTEDLTSLAAVQDTDKSKMEDENSQCVEEKLRHHSNSQEKTIKHIIKNIQIETANKAAVFDQIDDMKIFSQAEGTELAVSGDPKAYVGVTSSLKSDIEKAEENVQFPEESVSSCAEATHLLFKVEELKSSVIAQENLIDSLQHTICLHQSSHSDKTVRNVATVSKQLKLCSHHLICQTERNALYQMRQGMLTQENLYPIPKITLSCKMQNISTALKKEMEMFQEMKPISQEVASMYTVQTHLRHIIEIITEYFEIIQYRIATILIIPTEQQKEEFEAIADQISALQHHLETLSAKCGQITSSFSVEMQENLTRCIALLQDQFFHISSSLENGMKIAAITKGREETLTERMKQLTQEVEKENQTIQQIASKLETSIHRYTEIMDISDSVSTYWQTLCSIQAEGQELVLHCATYKMPYIDEDFCIVQCLQDKVCDVACTMQEVSSTHESFLVRMTHLATLVKCGEIWVQQDINVAEVNDLNLLLNKYKIFFNNVQANLTLVDSLYYKLSPTFQAQYADNYCEMKSLTRDLLQRAGLRGQELELCIIKWKQLLHLLTIWIQWVNIRKEKHQARETVGATLDEDIIFLRNTHMDMENHIPQIAAIKLLSSSVKNTVRCQSLEDQVDNLIQKWNLIKNRTEKELADMLLFQEKCIAFEADVKEFQTWIYSSEQQAICHLNITRDTENADATETLKNIVALQAEQENKELLMSRITQALQTSKRLNAYDNKYGETVVHELEFSWQKLTDILQSSHNIVCETLSKLPAADLMSKLQSWLESTEINLNQDKMQNIGSFSDAYLNLSKYQKIKLEIQAMQALIKMLSAIDIKETKSSEPKQQICSFNTSILILNYKWQEVAGETSARLKKLNMLVDKWSEFRDISDGLFSTICKHKIKVTQILNNELKEKECVMEEVFNKLKAIEEDWENQTKTIEELSTLHKTLKGILPCDFIHSQAQTVIGQIEKQFTELKELHSEAIFLLDKRKKKWISYHHVWESLNCFCSEMEYSLSVYKLPLLHPTLCISYIEEMKLLADSLTNNENLLKELENETSNLRSDCKVSVQLELDTNLEVAQERWNSLLNSIAVLQQPYFNFYSQWEIFVSKSRSLQEWISNINSQATKLGQNDLTTNDSSYQQTLLVLNEKEEEILQLEELENYFAKAELCDQSANHTIHSIVADCKESLLNLKPILQCKVKERQKNSEEMTDCQRHMCYVSRFLNTSEEVILCDADNASVDKLKEMLGNIKALMFQIPEYEVVLLSLKEKLTQCNTLTPQICDDVLQLLLHWKRFRINLNEKYVNLEEAWLQKQKFVGKCRSILLFLHELQNQLMLDIPNGYDNILKEYCKLQTLELKSYIQEKVLHSLISEGLEVCETMDDGIAEKFIRQLNELQDQWTFICKLLTERQNIVINIISLWKQYYTPLNKLQSWIERTEKQDILFKRVSLVTFGEINRNILKIEAVANQKMFCDAKYQELLQSSTALVSHQNAEGIQLQKQETDEIKNKLDDIWNILQSKKAELLALQDEWNKIESKIEEFKQMLQPIKSVVQEGILLSYDDLSNQLKEHKFQKERLKELGAFIDGLEEMINELDGKFTSSETSQIRNNITDFRQILVTLHHQLVNRMCIIEKKLHEWSKFHIDCSDLLLWIMETEKDILERGDNCLEKACQKLEKDYHSLIEQKSESYNDIVTLGETLIVIGGDKGICVQEDLEELQAAWRKLNLCRVRRLEKLQGLLEEMRQLQRKMAELNEWMENKEFLLFVPIVYGKFAHSEIIRHTEIMEEYEEDIETHYRDLRSVISLCEMLIHDNDAIVNPVERDALQRSVESFKRRWKEVGTLPAERKLSIEETWSKWKKIMIDLDELESLISDFESQIEAPKSNAILHVREESCQQLKKFESLYQSFQPVIELLESVKKQYEELLNENRLDSEGSLRCRVEGANLRWLNFTGYLDSIVRRLSHTLQLWEEFQIFREQLLLWLTELDLHLTEIQYFPERYSVLQTHLKAFDDHEEELNMMDQLALHLQQRSEASDSVRAEEMVEEIHHYWNLLLRRILHSQQKLTEKQDEKDDSDDTPLDKIAEGNKTTQDDVDAALPIIVTDISETTSEYPNLDTKGTTSSCTVESQDPTGIEESTVWQELENALKETEERLSVTEEALRSQTPIGFETEHVPHDYLRLLAACRSSIDILKHFSELIEGESKGLSQAFSPCYHHAQGIISRWEVLELKTIEKERRLHQARHQWQQYMNDLIAIENWLETAEDRQSGWSSPARDMAKLEVMIQSHREFLMEMIKHKPTTLSLNMLTQKFLSSSHGDEAEGLHLRIKALNKKWESVCQAATSWQNELQKALLQCSEFRNTLQELIMWLESSEERIHHMGSTEAFSDNNLISIQYNKYLELKRELERCKPRIMTFQQTADSLFTPSVVSSAFGAEVAEGDTAEIHEQLENANQRLQALMGKCNTEIERLRCLLQFEEDKNYLEEQYARADVQHGEVRIASEEDLERSQINHCYRYLTRVAKASLPIQGLMLLLLGIASLVPMSEDDFSCVLTNNFARSFEPMLQYPDGPPPV